MRRSDARYFEVQMFVYTYRSCNVLCNINLVVLYLQHDGRYGGGWSAMSTG